ncbi:MAG: T9SS type A sorting domain-containing protein [Aureispira sp.]|nr:T9SS type A sorting domain-containing protein [Aureispira sp.]
MPFLFLDQLNFFSLFGKNCQRTIKKNNLSSTIITYITFTILWYDAPLAGNIVGYGNSFGLSNITSNQMYYPEAVRGNLYFDESLFTSETTTTNWNGFMFDIVALDNIMVDSLSTKFNTTGTQNVVAYYKTGSYVGNENNSAAWTAWGTVTVQVNAVGDFEILDLPDIALSTNDTLAVYLHMQTSGSRLSYLSSSTGLVYANNEMQILSGSGISYTFGTTYTPRNFSGEVFYHHGFNPTGDCNTARETVHAVVSEPTIDLGNDTTLYLNQDIVLNINTTFDTYLWSNNAIGDQLLVDTASFSVGANTIWLNATDVYGCTASDTIVVSFTVNSGLEKLQEVSIQLVPNPTDGLIYVLGTGNQTIQATVLSANGATVREQAFLNTSLDLSDLPKGVYFISFQWEEQRVIKKVVLC